MANFSNLEILDFTGNDFTGSIPPYIGALSSLRAISLSDMELYPFKVRIYYEIKLFKLLVQLECTTIDHSLFQDVEINYFDPVY